MLETPLLSNNKHGSLVAAHREAPNHVLVSVTRLGRTFSRPGLLDASPMPRVPDSLVILL